MRVASMPSSQEVVLRHAGRIHRERRDKTRRSGPRQGDNVSRVKSRPFSGTRDAPRAIVLPSPGSPHDGGSGGATFTATVSPFHLDHRIEGDRLARRGS